MKYMLLFLQRAAHLTPRKKRSIVKGRENFDESKDKMEVDYGRKQRNANA